MKQTLLAITLLAGMAVRGQDKYRIMYLDTIGHILLTVSKPTIPKSEYFLIGNIRYKVISKEVCKIEKYNGLPVVHIYGAEHQPPSNVQNKTIIPKPIDTTLIERTNADTLYGEMSVEYAGGTLIGEGMIIKRSYQSWFEPMYAEKDNRLVDSLQNIGKMNYWNVGMTVSDSETPYMKIKGNWELAKGPFILKPY